MPYTPIYTSATNVYSKTGLSSSEVNLSDDDILRAVVEDAEVEVELITGRKWTNANSKVEYVSGRKPDVMDNLATSFRVSEYPLQSVTALLFLNSDGTTNTTFDTLSSAEISAGTFINDDYVLTTNVDGITNTIVPNGEITFITEVIPTGTANVKVTYTHGYATVPVAIRNLATCLAGIRAWVRFLGGSFNRINSYSIPEQSVNKGDFYARGRQSIEALQAEADKILDQVGRRDRVAFFGST